MIDYGDFHFAAPPRTGARWFINVAQLAGYGPGFCHRAYELFEGDPTVLRVSMIAHPFRWLYRIWEGIRNNDLDYNLMGKFLIANKYEVFEDFINAYLLVMPGSVSQFFSMYQADTIFRLEDMPWAMSEFLECLDANPYHINMAMESNGTGLNTGPPRNENIQQLQMEVVRAEWDLCDRYEYY